MDLSQHCIMWLTPHEVDEKKMVNMGYRDYKKLPLPRFEMRILPGSADEEKTIWVYGIVYRHMTNCIMFIPFSQTEGSRSYATMKKNAKPHIHFRDGIDFRMEAALFNFPNFILYDGTITTFDELNKDIYSIPNGIIKLLVCTSFCVILHEIKRLCRENSFSLHRSLCLSFFSPLFVGIVKSNERTSILLNQNHSPP